MKLIKYTLIMSAFVLMASYAQATTFACDPITVVPKTFNAPDAGSIYALAALASGGVALARRFMR